MKVYSYLPHGNFVKFDKDIFRIDRKEMKDGAKILYLFLASFKPGKGISQNYILKSLGIARTTLQEYIRQLKEFNLIYMQRTGPRTYDLFVGSTGLGADVVAYKWQELTEKNVPKALTKEEISRIQYQAKAEIEREINESINVDTEVHGSEEEISGENAFD